MNAVQIGDVKGSTEDPQQKRCIKCQYLDRNSIFIYLSHFLSSFGDRVWHFAVGLYLYYLHPSSLTLTAVYGLSTCACQFILGAPVGRWADKSNRLAAARITIVIQNAAVVFNAIIMASALYYAPDITAIWSGRLELLIYASIIFLEMIAELASMANKLVLEKDWIVVLARGDKQKLSYLNATMRTINLSCKILAPFAVGHLLEWVTHETGAIFIASWNVISAFAEFYLLHIIFSVVPELSIKSKNKGIASDQRLSSLQIDNVEIQAAVESPAAASPAIKTQPQVDPRAVDEKDLYNNNDATITGPELQEISLNSPTLSRANSRDRKNTRKSQKSGDGRHQEINETRGFCQFWDGWKVYFSHPVKFAGLGLASLYMTVLSFDSVSIGYLSSQGVSASLSGNVTAAAALIGILGSLSFPFVKRKFGQNRAGIFGFTLEILCLLFCVLSLLAPGSPFISSSIFSNTPRQRESAAEVEEPLSLQDHWENRSNVFLLVGGIALARYGLWIADLSVTQIFQEKVHESERGVMGGVQGSLNQLLSLVKFCLTIMLPYPETFGYLICLSWLFVFMGWIFFVTYVLKDGRRTYPMSNHKIREEVETN